MKAKEWLKENGHIAEITRGRISLENHARLQAAYDEGTRFSDWPKGAVTVSSTPASEGSPAKAIARVAKSEAVADNYGEAYIRYANWESLEAVSADGKRYTLKEACNNCGLSLLGHKCDSPSVLSKPVMIQAKRK